MPHPLSTHHRWHFFRAGGFDQVRIESGQDFLHLDQLDQKLWVALACPAKGLEFDPKTLALLDTDHDNRIRAPEIIAAAKWTAALLKNPDELLHSHPTLPLASIDDTTPEGKSLLASARQILVNLGQPDAPDISPEDTADTVKIFANTHFNGDGIIPPDAAGDPALAAVITDIIKIMGAETDRSGKPGVNEKKVELFFADAAAFADWHDKLKAPESNLPLGENSAAAAAALRAVAPKVEDYFTRCRLAAFDPRSTAAVNRTEADYALIAGKDLSAQAAEVAAFPLAKIAPDAPLPLANGAMGINPAWRSRIEALVAQVITPLLGQKDSLTESDWNALIAQFAPVDSWLAAKAGATVEPLGAERIREILASNAAAKTAILDLIAKDQALEPEASAIAAVDKLVHFHRDLFELLNNFVSFRHFYSRQHRHAAGMHGAGGNDAVFQVGTLFLDQRACDLCVRVDDPARHALMAHLSRTYLAYCDLTRTSPDGALEKLSIAAAYTAGDSDNLMVGRNGIFYDRHGRDWDAVVTKIVENPISIRQAFFSPYKRALRAIGDQVAKRAAAADAQATERLQNAAVAQVVTAVPGAAAPAAPPPPPPPPPKSKMDVGVVAALGVALGALSTAFGYFLSWLGTIHLYYIPLYVLAVILMISLPSMLIAWFKLRQRNLGPILDANGWAVNAKAKINLPFGRSLTQTPKLPPHAVRNLTDPYAEKHSTRNWVIVILFIVLALAAFWYFGLADQTFPDVFPESPYMQRQQAAAQDNHNAAPEPKPNAAPTAATTSPATSQQ